MLTLKSSIPSLRYSFTLLVLSMILATGCSTNRTSNVPENFSFMMDVHSADQGTAQNVNIRIDARGEAEFDIYETGGVIQYDTDNIVTYKASQIVKSGKFHMDNSELEQLWEAINQNNFFGLTDDYRMAMGHSYAFVMVEADRRKHMVDNIGMEVPEIRALVEVVGALMPEGINLKYGEGYTPQK